MVDGIHVPPEWINDAHRGNPSTLYHVGTQYYEKGCNEKAIRFYVLSGAKGNTKAIHQMGDIFRKGYGVSKDVGCAINWYVKGAKLDRTGFCSKIALIFEKGEGVKRSVYKALEWHHKDRIGPCFVAALNKEDHRLLEQDKSR
jgi:TPR repeat protein